ncbi:type VI secretion system tip protein VgrG [Neisseria sp. Dent CA1/247]|uniref:type VI secretion system Vgr family protein n=1 Tax=Neisseria sp. Dent CA1/247 TaxID=2912675 RepID=UPI001FD564DD|nr:type VI secretion system Vgr family protein [Neisseria sp. Dent CA1/247]UOO76982.1 type VI secretion system tip protein VgrG [Neisseria sp. Dent CA1/247]
MQTQSYHLTFSRFSPSLSVVSFTATEALNTAYRLDIELTCADADLPLSSYINQAAKFTVTPVSSDALGLIEGMIAPQALKEWSGIITSCEKLSVSADETRYRMVLEPRIAALKHHRTSRLFQNQNVPDIIAALLKHHGFSGVDFRFNTSREYGVREYVTQYQESDFAFLNRLCEEEGIWYAFEQNAQYGEVAVFGDDAAHYFRGNTSPYPYRPHGRLESVGKEAVFALQVKHNPILESIRVGDYNYRDADTDLSSTVTAKGTETDGSVLLGSDSHWGLHHKTPEEAQLQTALLQQLDHSRRIVASGSGNITALSPGQVFQTAPAFSEAPNGWLVVSLTHSGSRDSAYSHTFTAIPADSIFRPERLTPLPKIQGSLPARVTSPGNYTYAYIDNMGRYRVKLPFDLDEWSPGGESRPIRLAKPYAGPDYGQHFPLHEGTEVMLSFVQGNPDRPYISGVMHDSSHPDHVPADWNTRNVIRTWANNKLRMEDKQGQEHIKLATEYGKTQLNLGHIVDSQRQKRGDNGEGFELRTDSWGSLRAGKGLFISSDGQSGAQGTVLNRDEAIANLEQALSLAKSLNKAANTAKAEGTLTEEQEGRLKNCIKDLYQQVILLSAPDGIATATPQSQLHTAGQHIHHISGGDTDISAGSNFTAHAVGSVNLFAQSNGAKLQANQGKVEIQAQNDEMQINALKDATITSSAGKVTVAAKDEILLTSGGAYIKIKDGNIELGCPKMVWVKCAGFQVMGPSSLNVKTPLLPTTGIYSRRFDFSHIFAKDILEQGLSYQVIHRGQNSETFEKLDHDGRTSRFFGDTQDEIEVAVIGKLTEDGKWRLTEEKHCDLHDECCCGAEDEQDYQENTDEDVDDINTDDLIEDFNNFGN